MLLEKQKPNLEKTVERCPYCQGTKIVKKGKRKKKMEEIQIYFCKHCQKKFTPQISKSKTYPLRIILEAITLYNRLWTTKQIVDKIKEKYGFKLGEQTILNWAKDYRDYLPFLRMRDFIAKKYSPKEIIEEIHLMHGQIYDFKYHRAKTDAILDEDFKHYKLRQIKEFLELVTAECPHNVFRESENRASQYKNFFNPDEVKIVNKNNTAGKIVRFVVQAVANNKLRHQILQEFMLVNDSVTVAVEVPVLLDQEDVLHFQNHLNWQVPVDLKDGEVITGHIDIIQVRNGMIHVMDYKPSARKAKPVDQLTLYALALSRLTSLRLFHFKCAWFDENDYFEFYPLHMVMKKKKRGRKK
jgi:transposase-like protein